MEDVIKIPARYGYVHELRHIDGKYWQFVCDPKSSGYIGVGGELNHIISYDPDGGPYMYPGMSIGDKVIMSISSTGVFELDYLK